MLLYCQVSKNPVKTRGFRPCRGQIYASVDLQSEKAGLYLSMPPQSAGRMDDVAANGCIFGQIRSSIYMTLQKILPAAESGYLLKERRKAFMRRNSFIEIERPPQPKPFILTEKYPRLK